MGDFNWCLNRELETKHMPQREDVGNYELNIFIENNELMDIWHLRYPNKNNTHFHGVNQTRE